MKKRAILLSGMVGLTTYISFTDFVNSNNPFFNIKALSWISMEFFILSFSIFMLLISLSLIPSGITIKNIINFPESKLDKLSKRIDKLEK